MKCLQMEMLFCTWDRQQIPPVSSHSDGNTCPDQSRDGEVSPPLSSGQGCRGDGDKGSQNSEGWNLHKECAL